MEVRSAVQKLIKLSPSIRVVSVCDLKGRLVYTGRSKRVKMVLSKAESTKSLHMAAQAWRERKRLSRKLGPCKYVVAEYAKVKRITMPAGKNHLLYITTTAAFDHNKVIRKVRAFR